MCAREIEVHASPRFTYINCRYYQTKFYLRSFPAFNARESTGWRSGPSISLSNKYDRKVWWGFSCCEQNSVPMACSFIWHATWFPNFKLIRGSFVVRRLLHHESGGAKSFPSFSVRSNRSPNYRGFLIFAYFASPIPWNVTPKNKIFFKIDCSGEKSGPPSWWNAGAVCDCYASMRTNHLALWASNPLDRSALSFIPQFLTQTILFWRLKGNSRHYSDKVVADFTHTLALSKTYSIWLPSTSMKPLPFHWRESMSTKMEFQPNSRREIQLLNLKQQKMLMTTPIAWSSREFLEGNQYNWRKAKVSRYWVPNVSGGLVISKIPQKTEWDYESNVRYAQIAERVGFEYALSQIRFMAGYGAVRCHSTVRLTPVLIAYHLKEHQHESVSFSQALLHNTTKLNVIAALLPGPWNPAVAAKQIASIDHYSNGRISVNVVSGWFKQEFTSIGQWWLEHAERYRFDSAPPKFLERTGADRAKTITWIHSVLERHLDRRELHI